MSAARRVGDARLILDRSKALFERATSKAWLLGLVRAARESLRPILIGGVTFVAVLLGTSVWIAQRERSADEEVVRTIANEDRISRVLAALQDAELGQRGFLLTGDELSLAPYDRAVEDIGGAVDALAAGVADTSRQDANVAVLRPLVAQRLSDLRQTVQRRRAGDAPGAVADLRTGQGAVLMDGIREVLSRMRSQEQHVRETQAFKARRAAFRIEAAVIGLALLAAVSALIGLRSTLRRARSAEASRDELLARMDRKLMAVMAADVVGYSRLMEEDEAGTLARLKHHREEIDRLIADHGGTIVGTSGDSILTAFESALSAVDCAVAIQRALAAENAGRPEDRQLQFRIGINVGDVIVQEGDIFGDTVNVAARLEPLADPGGICISRAVRDHVRKQVGLSFDDLGFKKVKNIARPVSTYRVRFDADAAAAPAQTTVA